ncbi:hypothetical protein FIBSPDRAFT_945448 [Athelia psychrophila]|uniref:VWFA domain-containing protein n=1 Tax=Athelia psychrophila TaxID=1759441 RepID=A0A166TSP4_9AGAM|nr:hypothetical protein FIBSPDRAFT_945448 [Fibularhizoctonia sp. CBS 109695]
MVLYQTSTSGKSLPIALDYYGTILTALHTTSSKIGGATDLPTALSVVQLAFKHRENKNLRRRIIVFAASPLGAGVDERALVRLAKKLKKNHIAFGADRNESICT